MAFTVSRLGAGTYNSEFEAYARLLRQRGVDLGKLPRAPDPMTGRHWLYVWSNEADAQAFADELKRNTEDTEWVVQAVSAPPSEGPLGPIIVQVGRRVGALVFGLHPLSRTMIQSAFPTAKRPAVTVSIAHETLQTTRGTLKDLTQEVLPSLTGLTLSEIEKVGYAVIEEDSDRTLVFVKPGDLVQS